MAEIRSQIIPARGIRVTTDQVPGFPDVDVSAVLCDIDGSEKIDVIYEEIQSALKTLDERSLQDKDPEAAITKLLRARQRIEILKIPAAVGLAQDRLEQGFSVGIFVNFRSSIEYLSKKLDCPIIDGTVTGWVREKIISDFQVNKVRCLALNSEAGGISISLQDLDGEHPRFGIVFPGFSATVLTQVLGRFRRDGGKSKCHYRIVFAANTVEARVKKIIDQKMENLAALLDSDLMP